MTRLSTRLAGHRVVMERRPSGVGTFLWVGEFRDDNDRPLKASGYGLGLGAAPVYEVRCGLTPEEVLAGLADTLTRLRPAARKRRTA